MSDPDDSNSPATATFTVTVKEAAAALAAAVRVSIDTGRALVDHGRASIRLSCAGATPGSACRGTLTLTSRTRIVSHAHDHCRMIHKTIVIARAGYGVRIAHTTMIGLRPGCGRAKYSGLGTKQVGSVRCR